MLRNFAYVRANSLNEALKQLEAPGSRIHAGGTDLLGCLRDNVMQAQTLVSIGRSRRSQGHHAPAGWRAQDRCAGDDHRNRK